MKNIKWVLIVVVLVQSVFSKGILCKKKADREICKIGNKKFEIFDNISTISRNIRWKNMKVWNTGYKKTSCFLDKKEKMAECLLANASGISKPIFIHQVNGSFDERRVKELIFRYINKTNLPKATKHLVNNKPMVTPPINRTILPKVAIPKEGVVEDRAVVDTIKRPAWTNFPKNQRLWGDIDGDGEPDIVVWQKYGSRSIGTFYRLFVYNKSGKLLWQSPPTKDTDNIYAFGKWDFGTSFPQVLIDIDGDGQAELLAPSPNSYGSPLYYRIFGWNGHKLVPRRPAILMRSNDDPNRFIWVNPYPGDKTKGSWVVNLSGMSSIYEAVADIISRDPQGNIQKGKAILHFDLDGASVQSWIVFLPRHRSNQAYGKSRSYFARIGVQDHYNSQGMRLLDLNAILHQDRANYYKGFRDKRDTGINFFNTLQTRQQLDQMRIEPVNISLWKLKEAVINGTPLLKVTILPDRLKVEKIED